MIEDWMAIMDRNNPKELAWIRRNITALRKEKNKKKRRNN